MVINVVIKVVSNLFYQYKWLMLADSYWLIMVVYDGVMMLDDG